MPLNVTRVPGAVKPPVRIEVHLPLITIVRGGGALLAAYALCVLWPLLLLVFLALFLAVTLHAFVAWLDSRRMKHWASLLLVIGGLLTLLGVGMALLVPALINQAACFGQAFPQLRAEALDQIPVGWGLRHSIEHLLDPANWAATTINGLWNTDLTLAAAQTVTFAADTVLTTGLTFNYAGIGNANEFCIMQFFDCMSAAITHTCT